MEKETNKIINTLQNINFEGIMEEKPTDFRTKYTKIDDLGESFNTWNIRNGILKVEIYDTNIDDGIETFIGTLVKSSMRNVKGALGWLFFELCTIFLLLISFLSPIILIIAAITVTIFSVLELRYKKLRKEVYRKKLLNTNFYKNKTKVEKNVNLFFGDLYKRFYYKLVLKLLILMLWFLGYIGTTYFGLI